MQKSVTSANNPPILLALTAITLFVVAYFPVFQILVQIWASSEEYKHAFLTFPILSYMVWRKRSSLAEGKIQNTSFGLFLVVLAMPVYCFAMLTEVNTIIFLSTFLTVLGALIYLVGVYAVKELLTPLFLLLIILIPIPEQLIVQLTFPLQLKVSQASEIIVRIFGVSLLREGNIMNIPEKSFEVVEACSGLRSMITLMTLSLIMGYFTLRKNTSKLILIMISFPTAIFVNIVRITVMILLFYYFKIDVTEGTLHRVTGIMIISIALLILFLLQRLLVFWETK